MIGSQRWSLERAAIWNGWSGEETLMQLAGYLRNKALQEWNLLNQEHRNTFEAAVKALRARLDPGNQTLAALFSSCCAERLRSCSRLHSMS